MDYKEKYEQAIERLKQWDREHPCAGYVLSDRDKFIFPELAESEDEKVRKELTKHLKELSDWKEDEVIPIKNPSYYRQWASWLEKQGEHANFRNKIQVGDKVTRNEAGVLVNLSQLKRMAKPNEKQSKQIAGYTTIVETGDGGINALVTRELPTNGEQNPTDKVEPKFKVGDFIVNDYCMGRVVEITNDAYLLDTEQGIPFSCHSTRLWDVTKDAKDGDVLANDTTVLIVDHLGTFENRPIIYSWYFANSNKFYGPGPSEPDRWEVEGFYPATKEQREQLKKAMADAGYTFDFERKELKKIEQKPADKIEPKFKVKYAGGEYNVLEIKEIAGVTYYGIEDEPNHIDYVLPDNCEVIGGFGIKENGLSHPTKPAMFSEQKTQRMVSAEAKEAMYDKPTEWTEEDGMILSLIVNNLKFIRDTLSHDDKYTVDVGSFEGQIEWLQSIQDRVQPQPKQEWNEEDKDFMYDTLSNLTELKDRYGEGYGNVGRCIDWIKSIKGRVQPQNTYNPYKAVVESIAEMCKHYDKASHSGLRDFYDNVKVKCKDAQEYDKMFPQAQWKPSELQLGCLSDAIEYYNSSGYPAPKLKELLDDLKKLKE